MNANFIEKLLGHNYESPESIIFKFFGVFFVSQYLSKIKILQLERDRGEWEGLAPDVRREKESSLQMFGQLGRFHNIMSNETIGTLAFLTSGQTQRFNSLGAVFTFS